MQLQPWKQLVVKRICLDWGHNHAIIYNINDYKCNHLSNHKNHVLVECSNTLKLLTLFNDKFKWVSKTHIIWFHQKIHGILLMGHLAMLGICLNQGVPCPITLYLFHLSCPNLGHQLEAKVANFNFTYHTFVLQLTLHQIQNQAQIGQPMNIFVFHQNE